MEYINTDELNISFIESSVNAIIVYQGNTIKYVNTNTCLLTGYKKEELIGMAFWQLASNSQEAKKKGLARQQGQEIESNYELNIRHKNGHDVWVHYTARKIIWEGQTAIIGYAFDLSQQKEIENKLLDSEQRYKTLADITNEAIFFSHEGIGIDCNKTAENMFGYTREEIIGMEGTTIVSDEYKSLIVEHMLNDYKAPYEAVGIKKDGTLFPIEVQGSQIIYKNKKTRVTIVRDISVQKHNEEKIRQSENKYRTLTESLTDCVFMLDPKGYFTYLSPVFETITNYKINEFIGEHFLKGIAEDYHEKIFNIFTSGVQSESKHLYEVDIISKDKQRIPIEISSSTLLDEKRKVIGRIGTFRDIRQQKETKKALLIAKEKAEESDRLKTAFLQNMSHEIRTPLNGILGFADLLREQSLNEEDVIRYSNIIHNSGSRLLGLINNILDISKIEAGNISVNPKTFILNHLLKDIENLLKTKATEKSLVFKVIYGLETNNSYIITDSGKLNQILINLVNNALKFTSKGEVVLSYKVENNQLLFSVTDTGIGISSKNQKLIFDRFYQTNVSKSRDSEGAGLGLSITKSLVELLGGQIGLDSKMGEGSNFWFTIPYKTTKNKRNTKKDIDFSLSNRKLNILVADDDDASYLYMEALFSRYNVTLYRAVDGEEAIDFCENTPVDLVLMDISMPKRDGLEATTIIKQLKPNLPIIVQSAYAFSDEQNEAFEIGCDGFISKPIVKKDLLKQIKKLFSN